MLQADWLPGAWLDKRRGRITANESPPNSRSICTDHGARNARPGSLPEVSFGRLPGTHCPGRSGINSYRHANRSGARASVWWRAYLHVPLATAWHSPRPCTRHGTYRAVGTKQENPQAMWSPGVQTLVAHPQDKQTEQSPARNTRHGPGHSPRQLTTPPPGRRRAPPPNSLLRPGTRRPRRR